MHPEETIRKLREELQRVSDERDRLKKTVLQFMAEQMPEESEEDVRKEIEEIRKDPIPFDRILEEIRTRLGIAS